MRTAFRSRSRAGVAVAAALLLVVACGDDDGGSSTTAAATTAAATTAAVTTAAPTTAAATTAAPTTAAATTEAPTTTAAPDTLKIGVAVADASVFEAQAPQFGIGDAEEQAKAVLDGWTQDGLLPVNNHNIEFVYRKYSLISDDEKLAACTGFAEDDEVVAVIGGRDFGVGAACLTQRFNIPVIDVNSVATSAFDTNGPAFFTLRPDQNVQFKQFIDWADAAGYLTDKKIGVAYSDENSEAWATAKAELEAKGYTVASEIQTTGAGVGSDQDTVAIQQFITDGADLLMLFVGGSSVINMLFAADGQGYAPDIVDLDVSEHTTDVLAGILPASIYAGTNAMTSTRTGDVGRDGALTETAEKCMANYERFSGKTIPREAPEPSGEFTSILITCDVANLMLTAITNAGATVDADSIIAGFESISEMVMASTGNVTFTADDHWGAHEFRTIQFDGDRKTWVAQDDFQPFAS